MNTTRFGCARSRCANGTRGRQARAGGFTLLETLVALAIVAISLASVTKLVYQLAGDTSAVFDKTMALLVAENQLTRLQLGLGTPDASGEQTLLNVAWRYRVEREDTPDPRVEKVTVVVSLASGPDDRLASLTTYLGKAVRRTGR